jgi:hypothetical protein
VLLVAASVQSACQPSRHDLCALSANRHSWQGLKVYADGYLLDVRTIHGGGPAFFCKDGGTLIGMTTKDAIYREGVYYDYSAVASYRIQGVIEYQNHSFLLRPTRLIRTSSWGTEENGGMEAFIKTLRNKAKE